MLARPLWKTAFACVLFATAPCFGESTLGFDRRAILLELKRAFLAPVDRSEEPTKLDLAPEKTANLRAQVAFLRAGRVEEFDDWATYADMVVFVAGSLEIFPPESLLARYRGRVRPISLPLTAEEARARSALLGSISSAEFVKRYLYIPGAIDTPEPKIALAPLPPPPVPHGKKSRKSRVAHALELAPPPKAVSVIDRVDWDAAEQLADVADSNAHNWDRRKGESPHRYARRLRRLRKHCYEWVRRDIAALGLWDELVFRGPVPGTRHDPKRPIRAASFALAMARVADADVLSARTPLRELNLRVDPIVRGSILVFAQNACGSDRRSGHIEIITSVVPLRAASYKFHEVRSDCLAQAYAENKIHLYVPLRRETAGIKPTKS